MDPKGKLGGHSLLKVEHLGLGRTKCKNTPRYDSESSRSKWPVHRNRVVRYSLGKVVTVKKKTRNAEPLNRYLIPFV